MLCFFFLHTYIRDRALVIRHDTKFQNNKIIYSFERPGGETGNFTACRSALSRPRMVLTTTERSGKKEKKISFRFSVRFSIFSRLCVCVCVALIAVIASIGPSAVAVARCSERVTTTRPITFCF